MAAGLRPAPRSRGWWVVRFRERSPAPGVGGGRFPGRWWPLAATGDAASPPRLLFFRGGLQALSRNCASFLLDNCLDRGLSEGVLRLGHPFCARARSAVAGAAVARRAAEQGRRVEKQGDQRTHKTPPCGDDNRHQRPSRDRVPLLLQSALARRTGQKSARALRTPSSPPRCPPRRYQKGRRRHLPVLQRRW